MSVRSFGNPLASFRYRFGNTGNRASRPYVATISGITATGGVKEENVSSPDGKIYTYHYFTPTSNPQPFNVTNVNGPGEIEYILVAGGGAGGYSQNGDNRRGGGGGGAGGLLTNFLNHPLRPNTPGTHTVTIQNYSFTVGAGGPAPTGSPGTGPNGSDTTAFGYTAIGGGGGGANEGQNAAAGGSGGGAGADGNVPSAPGSGYPPSGPPYTQGYPGGAAGSFGGGGGGGATASGQPGSGGPGGSGSRFTAEYSIPNSYGTTGPQPGRYLAGGGGGGTHPTGNTAGSGGSGGGGAGKSTNIVGDPGTANTGGGGGGAGGGPVNTSGGEGGSGIIVIRYRTLA